MQDGPQRLQKVLARDGVASRRAAEEMIAAGRVSVNGQVVTRLGTQVGTTDALAVDGKPVGEPEAPVYVLLNKPPGYVTTVRDPQGRPTALQLVQGSPCGRGPALPKSRLYPVGRLDADSEGLLIVTNDGELAHHLTHPRFALEKEYRVLVRGAPAREALGRLRGGIELDGRLTAPVAVTMEPQAGPEQDGWLRFVLHEGRKREIRRICLAVGHPVQQLVRVRVGRLLLGDLPAGRWRYLTPAEVAGLRAASGAGAAPPK